MQDMLSNLMPKKTKKRKVKVKDARRIINDGRSKQAY